MYKKVDRIAYTKRDLVDNYRDSDLPRFKISKSDFDEIAHQSANEFSEKQTYIKEINISPRPKNKHLFTVSDLNDHLLVRQTCKVLIKYFGFQRFSRNDEVNQLLSVIRTEKKASIVRTDIKRFYESVCFEQIISKLEKTGFDNQSTIKHLKSFANKGSKHSCNGLLRGISFSSLLADFALNDFDSNVKLIPSCCYYCRYVDDILVVTTNDKIDIIDEIKNILPSGLQLNPEKTEPKKIIGDNEFIEFLGYSISLSNYKNVRIAESKINRAKKRIALSFEKFFSEKNFDKLYNRIQFLSTNTIMKMYSRSKPLTIGYKYAYPLCDENEALRQMIELDKFLHGYLNSKYYYKSILLNGILDKNEKIALSRLSFYQGYIKRITKRRSAKEISEIKKAWIHA